MAVKEKTLSDAFYETLKDVYWAEKQGTRSLGKAAKAAKTPELKQGMETHLQQTQQQIQRLEQIFQKLGQQPGGETNVAMQVLIQEAQKLMQQNASPDVLEAGLIACLQAMEHYEIAGYGTARTYAQLLGDQEAVQLLEQTLNEEKQADEQLTQIAQKINVEAMNS